MILSRYLAHFIPKREINGLSGIPILSVCVFLRFNTWTNRQIFTKLGIKITSSRNILKLLFLRVLKLERQQRHVRFFSKAACGSGVIEIS